MAVDDEGDGEGDHNGNHHEPGLQVVVGTIPSRSQMSELSNEYSKALPVVRL